MRDETRGVERDAVLEYVTRMLEEITTEWDVGPITETTRLGDLGLESINLVYLIAEVQHSYGLQDLLFRKLVARGTHINELHVVEIVDFVREILAAPQPRDGGPKR